MAKEKLDNPDELKAFMRLKPTLEDTAAFFDVSHDTIERYIKKHFSCSFAYFRDQNMVHTRMMLVRTAIQKAQRGDNVMLIFCLKNLCGWLDKPLAEATKEEKFTTAELIAVVKAKLPSFEKEVAALNG